MNIPDYLIEQIRAGNVVLFLGAGASFGATAISDPKKPPNGVALAKLLADKFLGGQAADKSLSLVAEYCNATADVRTVQRFISELFSRFEPGEFHKKIASFRWVALVTTNYDQILEKAYAANSARMQTPIPILRNIDRVDQELREKDKVALLKLHGCVTMVDDDQIPMILTIDQYITHKTGRNKLFNRFTELAGEYTVVFVGYQLEDPNIRAILMELDVTGMSRPTHYVVTPNVSALDQMVWARKKIVALDGTFEQFIDKIDASIPSALRSVHTRSNSHPIAVRFSTHATPSQSLVSFLENDALYIHAGMPVERADPKAFYRGASYGWSAHFADFDAKRNITDTVLTDVVLADESKRPRKTDVYLLKGYAGSGKTVALKRIALEAGTTFSKPTIFLRADARFGIEPIAELCGLLGERLFLFIDGAARRSGDLDFLIRDARGRKLALTFILAERSNEWNIECQSLETFIDDVFEMRGLASNEVDFMLQKLREADALGVLKGKTDQEQQQAFNDYADRQLLVALYEITSGAPFSDIVYNEYRNIVGDQAKRIYLVVCALNRLGVPVRAGLVKRVTGISLSDFKTSFFAPLESIVLTEPYTPAADTAYRARHPSIAQIVFQRALPNELERFDLYMALLKAIDIGYMPDRTAYRELIRSRNLMDLFSDPKLVDAIFQAAEDSSSNDGYLFQQRAIFEMKRANGNLVRAQDFLATARRLLPHDRSITHSLSELEIARANLSRSELERRLHLDQARKYAQALTGANASSGHGYSTLVKLELERLRAMLGKPSSTDEEVIASTKAVEQYLHEGLQQFRNDPHLLTSEAEFSSLLSDMDRADKALKKAYETNPGSPFVASALSRLQQKQNDPGGARATLGKALKLLPGDRRLNVAMGYLMQRHFPGELLEIESCWRKSFTPGDTNFTSQFWFARSLYLNGKFDEAFEVFKVLKTARASREVKLEIAGWIREDGKPKLYKGLIYAVEEGHAWVTPFGKAHNIYLNRSNVAAPEWANIVRGGALEFAIGFNYMGPAASVIAFT
jgi:tetratricopeptide (TPR) repeat protein